MIYLLTNPGRNPADRKAFSQRAKDLGINLYAEFKTLEEAQAVAKKATNALKHAVVACPGINV